MINVSTITAKIQQILLDNVAINAELQDRIFRNKFVNEDPNYTPWLCIYRNDKSLSPWTTGKTRNWKGTIKLKLVLQVASLDDGVESETRQEALEKLILDALHADKTLGGLVDMLIADDVSYTYASTTAGILMTNTNIDLTYEVRTDG